MGFQGRATVPHVNGSVDGSLAEPLAELTESVIPVGCEVRSHETFEPTASIDQVLRNSLRAGLDEVVGHVVVLRCGAAAYDAATVCHQGSGPPTLSKNTCTPVSPHAARKSSGKVGER